MKNFILFSMAFYVFSAPVLADDMSADSVDGGHVVVQYRSRQTEQKPAETKAADTAKPATKTAHRDANEEPEDDEGYSEDKKRTMSRSMWQAGIRGVVDTRTQGLGATVGYSGLGESANAMASFGPGQDKFKLDASLAGLRTGYKASTQHGVAGLFNAQASIGTSGNGVFNGVGAVAGVFRVSPGCRIVAGAGAGTAVGNVIGSGFNQEKGVDTLVFGPAGAVGGGCKLKQFAFDANVFLTKNLLEQGSRAHPSEWAGGAQVNARYMLNDSFGIFASASAVSDIHRNSATGKLDPLTNFTGTAGISYTFGHSNAPKEPEPKAEEAESAR